MKDTLKHPAVTIYQEYWFRRTTPHGTRVVCMECPKCGIVNELSDHAINDDGKVSPAVVCASRTCDWAGRVTLRGWAPKKDRRGGLAL